MATAYDQASFWKSYARLWFTDPEANDIKHFASRLASELKRIVKNGELNVLCLGIGIGSHEIPLLSAIQKVFGWKVNLVGIDRASGPLNVANRLISHDSISNSCDLTKLVDEWFAVDNQEAIHSCLDLDQKEWLSSIEQRIPSSGFDLVIASLCLHHLLRWRSVVVDVLSVTREGGLFLLSRADGDVRLFNGEFGGSEDCEKEKPLCEMMRSFWDMLKQQGLKRIRNRSSGISPVDQLSFLRRMPLEQMSFGNAINEYNISNSISTFDVLQFVESKGLSPFREAALHLGDESYKKVCDELASQFSADVEFGTNCKLIWSVFRMESQELLAENRICRKFRDFQTNDCEQEKTTELGSLYELEEAFAISQDAFNVDNLTTSNFVSSLERLAFAGVLHNDCVAGILGQQLVQRKRVSDILYFANPLSRREIAIGLKEHLAFVTSSPTTNTSTLLSKIIPRSKHPVILTFSLRASGDSANAKMGVTQGRSFISIDFDLTISENTRDALRNTDWYRALGKVPGEQDLINESGSVSGTVKGWTPQAGAHEEPDMFTQLVSSLLEQLKCQMTQTPGFVADYHDLINTNLMRSACSLSLITECTHAAIYPLVYLHPQTQSFAAADALIVLYNRKTDNHVEFGASLQRELYKFSTVFDQLSMRRLAAVSINDGIDQTFGAFSHEVSKFSSFLELGLFQPLGRVFDLSKTRNSTTESATGKWKPSAGTITANSQLKGVMDQWLACPIPEAVTWATDYLFLWAGTSDRIEKFVSSHALTLQGLFAEAGQIAVNSQLPAFAKGSDWHFEDVVQFEFFKEAWLEKLAYIDISAVPTNWFVSTNDKEFIGTVLRTLVATFANALKNSPASVESSIKASCEFCKDSKLLIQVTNDPRDDEQGVPPERREGGTHAVLRNCLRKFPNFDSGLEFGKSGHQWVTKFFLPTVTGASAQSAHEWIRVEN